MSPNPVSFLEHLRQQGYHPRSAKHSDRLSLCLVEDLVSFCPAIAYQAALGTLVYDLNFTILTGTAEWNVDLVLGKPGLGSPTPPEDGRIRRSRPSTVQIAIEHKSVMTEHHKAIKNRKRDFEAHHDHVHRYSEKAVAGGLLVVNAAASFQSPLRPEITVHRNPDKLVIHCIEQMRAVAGRSGSHGIGLDAKGVLVVDFSNEPAAEASYRSRRPAPVVGDPLHYDAFLQAICQAYTDRFGGDGGNP